MCCKWVCEDCNEVPVAKLKPIINKCRRIHFLCKRCDETLGTNETIASQADSTSKQVSTEKDLLASLKNLFDKKMTQLEEKIEKSIDKKVKELEAATDIIITGEKTTDSSEVAPSSKTQSFAQKVLQVPHEIRRVIQETSNEEKVDKLEREKRASNFIIHGAEEVGEDTESIKENDEQYIKDILERLDVRVSPVTVTRLGPPNDKKMRRIKVAMKSEAEKDKVMGNLRKLKGTEYLFGKISITSDYSSNDREMIKDKVKEAKKQQEENPGRIFKVRGDPKNGLRIVSYAKP